MLLMTHCGDEMHSGINSSVRGPTAKLSHVFVFAG